MADQVVLCALFNGFQYAVCNFQISDETKLYWAFEGFNYVFINVITFINRD